ncbi:nuclear transport factor 2 family protein [Lutimaribacter marinistellae]|uniref:Nuclear transport factor 2 family protein n=1 Tax=Lutimaribacter marinistellae TaxID=1820329 RepID=A0ABV7TCU1_9RHOB
MRTTVLAALALSGLTATAATTAPADHEYLTVHPAELPRTDANIATLDRIFEAIFARDWNAMRALYSDNYVQHSLYMEDGKEGVIDLFRGLDYNQMVYEPVLRIAEGPYVTMMSKLKFNAGAPMMVAIDLNFIRDGQSREHWDILMPVKDAEKAFGIALETQPEPQDVVDQNKLRVADFINTVFNASGADKVRDFVSGDYVQHGTGGDGPDALIEDVKTRFVGAEVDIKRIIGQNDLVLAHSRVFIGGKQFARADIWRLRDGMMVEHWAAMEPVPTEYRNPNSMF